MKRSITRLLGVLAVLLLWGNFSVYAQEKSSSKVVIVQTITHEDGTTTVVKKCLPGEDGLKDCIKTLKNCEDGNVEIHLLNDGVNIPLHIEGTDGETIMFFRRAQEKEMQSLGEQGERLRKELDHLRIVVRDVKDRVEVGENYNYNFDFNFKTDRPLLGVYLDEEAEVKGLKLSGVVSGKGAEAAGLRAGDVVTSMNGNALNNLQDLRGELANFKPGDVVAVGYIRDGRLVRTEITLSERSYSFGTFKRDPCKVFIGVYVGGHDMEGRGVRVNGVIEGWPAQKAGLQRGDIITALDGITVNDHQKLLVERNKHEPGEFFTVTYLRDGQEDQLVAQFRSCEEEKAEAVEEVLEELKLVEEEKTPEVIEVPEELNQLEPPLIQLDNSLQLENYTAYPNPTFGKVQLEFNAEAVPTVIRVTDVNGKLIYKEELNQFDGYYNSELNLGHAVPGALFLNIRQGEKEVAKKIILMARA